MTRGLMILAVWAAIQLFFISSFSMILLRVGQIYRTVKRIDKRVHDRANEVEQIAANGVAH